MSDSGQSRRFEPAPSTSALPLTPDILRRRSERSERAKTGTWLLNERSQHMRCNQVRLDGWPHTSL